MDDIIPQEVISAVPNDAQHPVLYERTAYMLGGAAGLCIIGIVGLLVVSLLKGGVTDTALAGLGILGTLAGSSVQALATLLTPRTT